MSTPEADTVGQIRPWSIRVALVVLTLVIVVSPIIAQLALLIYPHLKGWSSAQGQSWLLNAPLATFLYVLFAEGLTVGTLFLFISTYKKANFKRAVGLYKPQWRYVGYALVGILVYVVLLIIVLAVVNSIVHINTNEKQALGFSPGITGIDLVMAFAGLVILPPIAEEIAFRGFLYGTLRDRFPMWPTILITSLIFGGLHLFTGATNALLWSAFVDVFTLSLVLCYLREKTGTIWAGMGVHALKNLLAFLTLFVFHGH
jgi:membrane protease YdiL (CAAX protease family)